MEIDPGDVVALLALGVSAWSMKKTNDFNRRQKQFIETNDKLNQMLIDRNVLEEEATKRADVSANFYKAGQRNHRLKVFNKGKAAARNVRIEVLDDSGILMPQDIGRKFPIPLLEQHQSVELIGAIHLSSPSRVHIKLVWDDDAGNGHEKELHPSW